MAGLPAAPRQSARHWSAISRRTLGREVRGRVVCGSHGGCHSAVAQQVAAGHRAAPFRNPAMASAMRRLASPSP
jgi:hypothetical protein